MANQTSPVCDETPTNIRALMPTLPRWLRWVNGTAARLEQFGLLPDLLSADAIVARARRQTGLSDWAGAGLCEPLRMLTQPEVDAPGITLAGTLSLRRTLIDCVVNRLRIQAELARHPEIRQQAIVKPLFVASMPRTGSTLLQRLLSQDPRCRPLLCWEALHPAPAPHPDTHDRDPRIRKTEAQLRRLFGVFPELATMHYMDARTPEECEWLLQNSLVVPGFFAAKPEFLHYHAWCEARDRTDAYAYYKLQLQILQRHFPPAHWVLKGNEHVKHLDTLLKTFPDACVVQIHRDPVEAIPSYLSLTLRLFGLKYAPSEAFLADAVQLLMEDYAQTLARAVAARAQLDPQRFFDVRYEDLVRDPLGVIQRLYAYFDYPFTSEFAARIPQWQADNPKDKHGVHRYTLGQFGLDAEQVRARFRDYWTHVQRTVAPIT